MVNLTDQTPKTPWFQQIQEVFVEGLFNWIQRPAKAISGLGKAIVIGIVLSGLLLAPIRPPSAWGATDLCKVRNLEGDLQTVSCWALLCYQIYFQSMRLVRDRRQSCIDGAREIRDEAIITAGENFLVEEASIASGLAICLGRCTDLNWVLEKPCMARCLGGAAAASTADAGFHSGQIARAWADYYLAQRKCKSDYGFFEDLIEEQLTKCKEQNRPSP